MNQVFIHGARVSVSWADASLSLSEMIFDSVSGALKDSGIAIEQIDSCVLAAHDVVDGRSLSSMVTAPAAGAYLRDEIRLAEDGLAAASLAAARIEVGESKLSIVAAWGRLSEGDFDRTSRAAFDPFFAQPLGLTEWDVSGARLASWICRYGRQGEARQEASAARERRRAKNPRALHIESRHPALNYPLIASEGPRFADVAVTMLFGSQPSPIRIAGIGHSAEASLLGERDLVGMPALREAVAQARKTLPQDCELVYEIDGATLSDEVLALEALGLAERGGGFWAYAARDNVNLSGGSARGWSFPTNGLFNLAECYLQLAGRAGAVQCKCVPAYALATGASPMGSQIAHAIALGVS